MKHVPVFIFWVIIGFIYLSFAGDIIQNPEKPLNPEAGRILKLKKVMDIPGVGNGYVIISPYDLDIAPDGTLFLSDEKQLLVFTSDGVFLKNLYRKGQGPGELQAKKIRADIAGNKLYIFDSTTKKIIIKDLQGKLIKEKRMFKTRTWTPIEYRFIGVTGEKLLFRKSDGTKTANIQRRLRESGGKQEIVENQNSLVIYFLETEEERKIGDFPTKIILNSFGGGPMAQLRYRLSNDKLILSHTAEYLVNIVDLKNGKVKRFTREYKRIKYDASTPYLMGRKYIPDISWLYVFKNYIWVKTLAGSPEMGNLYDVFDFEGKYLDSFYLGFSGFILNTVGDYLFILLVDKDDNYYIAKYKVLDDFKPGK